MNKGESRERTNGNSLSLSLISYINGTVGYGGFVTVALLCLPHGTAILGASMDRDHCRDVVQE